MSYIEIGSAQNDVLTRSPLGDTRVQPVAIRIDGTVRNLVPNLGVLLGNDGGAAVIASDGRVADPDGGVGLARRRVREDAVEAAVVDVAELHGPLGQRVKDARGHKLALGPLHHPRPELRDLKVRVVERR